MKIVAKPMLERTRRAYELMVSKLNGELDGSFIMNEDAEMSAEKIREEIEASESMIWAINEEIRNYHQNR